MINGVNRENSKQMIGKIVGTLVDPNDYPIQNAISDYSFHTHLIISVAFFKRLFKFSISTGSLSLSMEAHL